MTDGRPLNAMDPARGEIYRRLGVEPIVNGRSTFTILGGSLMAPAVLDAMRQAADSFVDLVELQDAVGRRLAELTHNEAAFVSGGAAAGIFLSVAAAMVRDTADGVLRLAEVDSAPRDVVIHRAHRIPYDQMIALAGGRLVEIGEDGRTEVSDLEAALGPSTAAVLYVPKANLASAVLPLEIVIDMAHRAGIPVIVDAAAQLPPVENLWEFTAVGADLAVFSGGKGLCGPASTGLVLGRAWYVNRLAINAAPLQRLGRPMKVGKEDMIGLLAAVELYLARDHVALRVREEAIVSHVVGWGRGREDVVVERSGMGEAGQPTPRAWIRLVGGSREERDRLLVELRAVPPRVDLLPDDDAGFFVAPETLLAGEAEIITAKLDALLQRAADR